MGLAEEAPGDDAPINRRARASSQKLPKAFVTIHRRPQSSLYTLLVIIQGLYTLLVIGKLHICSPPPLFLPENLDGHRGIRHNGLNKWQLIQAALRRLWQFPIARQCHLSPDVCEQALQRAAHRPILNRYVTLPINPTHHDAGQESHLRRLLRIPFATLYLQRVYATIERCSTQE